jgi:hypothetical protein
MNGVRKGLVLAGIQILTVLSLGGKLLYDRAARPRAWVLCQVYDPELPIRGRYVAENLRIPAQGFGYVHPNRFPNEWYANRQWAYLEVRGGMLVAKPTGSGSAMWVDLRENPDGTLSAFTQQPVLIFIPDGAQIPSPGRGDELWVEVTVPSQGPPRPIRLAIKKNGVLTPINM